MMSLIKADALTWTEETHSTHPLREYFCKRDGDRPGYIIKPHWSVSIDHIVPDSLGGIDHPRNYMFVSSAINTSWTNASLEEKFHIMGRTKARHLCEFLKRAKAHFASQMNAYLREVGILMGAKVLI
jgi:hypothetical protein